jgi:hypothetical protein
MFIRHTCLVFYPSGKAQLEIIFIFFLNLSKKFPYFSRHVVLFTFERFIIVYFPFKRHDICTRRRNIIAMIVLVTFALVFYSFSLFSSGFEKNKREPACVVLNDWYSVAEKFVLVDSVMTLLIPLVAIFTINLLIITKLANCECKRLNRELNNAELLSLTNITMCNETLKFASNTRYSKTTKMLLIISTSFFVLNSPIAGLKLWYLFKNFSQNQQQQNHMSPVIVEINSTQAYFFTNHTQSNSTHNLKYSSLDANPVEEIIERITCYIYYINFALNFVLYSMYGSKFRDKLLTILTVRNKRPNKNVMSTRSANDDKHFANIKTRNISTR